MASGSSVVLSSACHCLCAGYTNSFPAGSISLSSSAARICDAAFKHGPSSRATVLQSRERAAVWNSGTLHLFGQQTLNPKRLNPKQGL